MIGVLRIGSLAISMIGYGLAKAKNLNSKHTIKQVDRLLSNKRFDVWAYFLLWIPNVVGIRKEIMVALDWT